MARAFVDGWSCGNVLAERKWATGCSEEEAGRGNRTLVFSLEGYCSTIELHPHAVCVASGPAPATHRDRQPGEPRLSPHRLRDPPRPQVPLEAGATNRGSTGTPRWKMGSAGFEPAKA